MIWAYTPSIFSWNRVIFVISTPFNFRPGGFETTRGEVKINPQDMYGCLSVSPHGQFGTPLTGCLIFGFRRGRCYRIWKYGSNASQIFCRVSPKLKDLGAICHSIKNSNGRRLKKHENKMFSSWDELSSWVWSVLGRAAMVEADTSHRTSEPVTDDRKCNVTREADVQILGLCV